MVEGSYAFLNHICTLQNTSRTWIWKGFLKHVGFNSKINTNNHYVTTWKWIQRQVILYCSTVGLFIVALNQQTTIWELWRISVWCLLSWFLKKCRRIGLRLSIAGWIQDIIVEMGSGRSLRSQKPHPRTSWSWKNLRK